jgi:sialidase-1
MAPRAAGIVVALVAAVSSVRTCAVEPERSNVFRRGEGEYHTYRIPAIVAAASGELVAFCEGRVNGAGDAGEIDVLCRRSPDHGRTWGPIEVVWDDGGDTCGNPCPVLDRETGVLWLLMTHNPGDDREGEIVAGAARGTRTVWVSRSDDHGATWAPPVEITPAVKAPDWTWYATGPGAGIQIEYGPHAGRLVIPCDHNDEGGRRWSHVIYSDDHGRSWMRGGATPRHQVNECEVVELAGGRLLLNMRSYHRNPPTRQRAVSDDGGRTWRDQEHDPALVEPVCQASIRRVSWPEGDRPGVILFSNPADAERRRNLTVRLSLDDGATWPRGAQLHAGSAAYSCLIALPGVTAGCMYEADDYERIEFAWFSLEWVHQGEAPAAPARE